MAYQRQNNVPRAYHSLRGGLALTLTAALGTQAPLSVYAQGTSAATAPCEISNFVISNYPLIAGKYQVPQGATIGLSFTAETDSVRTIAKWRLDSALPGANATEQPLTDLSQHYDGTSSVSVPADASPGDGIAKLTVYTRDIMTVAGAYTGQCSAELKYEVTLSSSSGSASGGSSSGSGSSSSSSPSGSGPAASSAPVRQDPCTVELTLSRDEVDLGDSIKLTWEATPADGVELVSYNVVPFARSSGKQGEEYRNISLIQQPNMTHDGELTWIVPNDLVPGNGSAYVTYLTNQAEARGSTVHCTALADYKITDPFASSARSAPESSESGSDSSGSASGSSSGDGLDLAGSCEDEGPESGADAWRTVARKDLKEILDGIKRRGDTIDLSSLVGDYSAVIGAGSGRRPHPDLEQFFPEIMLEKVKGLERVVGSAAEYNVVQRRGSVTLRMDYGNGSSDCSKKVTVSYDLDRKGGAAVIVGVIIGGLAAGGVALGCYLDPDCPREDVPPVIVPPEEEGTGGLVGDTTLIKEE